MFLGLLLIPLGALWKKRRIAKGSTTEHWGSFSIDLSRPVHRNALFAFLAISSLVVVASGIGSYQAYHYTESVKFCGTLCHDVMKPEYTTYQHSAHARVKCVDCHIGEGAGSFVKSKFNGLHQVYSVLAKKYPRPIPTPVKNLRPAKETCERCHWPEHFFSGKERTFPHFLGDEKNTRWTVRMLVNIGGGDGGHSGAGRNGIHWQMAIHNKISYIPRKADRQEIAWIKAVAADGTETVYSSREKPLPASQITPKNMRSFDCMDCHNRPSHQYKSPVTAVNEALSDGALDASLPSIKAEGVKALSETYASDEEANAKIAEKLKAFYGDKEPEKVSKAVKALQKIYGLIQFPFMKANWRSYPNNIGHMEFPGCFRCHGSDLATIEGKTLSRDCTLCHTILSQGVGPAAETISIKGLEFQHPVDVGVDMKDADCTACHTGGAELYS